MTRPLALHQSTAIEASPARLVEIAAEVGCEEVGIFVNLPPYLVPGHPISPADFEFEIVGQSHKRGLLDRMRDLGVGVANIEFFGIHPALEEQDYRAALELGGELGARGATVWILDEDEARAVDNLGRFCGVAAEFGLTVGLEFVGFTAPCNTIGSAVRVVDKVGLPNMRLSIDMLSMIRTGATAADVAALPARYFAYAQVADGYGTHMSSTYFKEAMDRLMPGEGDWPLQEILSALPATLPIDVEVPSRVARAAGMSALERSRWAVTATRKLLASLTPIR